MEMVVGETGRVLRELHPRGRTKKTSRVCRGAFLFSGRQIKRKPLEMAAQRKLSFLSFFYVYATKKLYNKSIESVLLLEKERKIQLWVLGQLFRSLRRRT